MSPLFLLLFFSACNKNSLQKSDYEKAEVTLKSIYNQYSVGKTNLLRETFPFDKTNKATYLADEGQAKIINEYSFLWPYSGSLSVITALYEVERDDAYIDMLENKILPGLEMYYDSIRTPAAYSSYINSAPISDRFYDDNIWLGLDFCDLYSLTDQKKYLDEALLIWNFIQSGTDTVLGGGIYWCEQKKYSKNTCSNAPGSVYAFKLFLATGDSVYLKQGKEIYEWTKANLQDPNDFLYYDNINLKGRINEIKYAYNSGQMMQAAALLYKITREEKYLNEARNIAGACYNYFFYDFQTQTNKDVRILKKGDIWFTAIMFRGFVELYKQDNNCIYIDEFKKNLEYAWKYMRDIETGLFNSDWSGLTKDNSKWLLTQFAMVEMYARMSQF